jgi:magnesium-transporting ATPase (P-type)
MDLEEMKSLWSSLSEKVAKQELVNKKLVMEMTQQKYKNKFSTLNKYETSGAILCFIFAFVILLNIGKMNTWYLQASAILTLLFLIVLPIFSLGAIKGMQKMDISKNTYKETVLEFSRRKKRMLLFQQLNMYLSIFLMWLVLPVFSMIFNGKDFFQQEHSTFLYVFIIITSIGVLLFARWGYGCYKRITASAEELLKELE